WTQAHRKLRVYQLQVLSVTDAQGRAWKYETYGSGAYVEIKIGDADRTVSGRQRYRIAYAAQGVLNGFPDHDELFWNVTGSQWPVPILAASATVRAPAAFSQSSCFAGPVGSTASCGATSNIANGAVFTSGRALQPGDDFTIVAGLRKGVVTEPRPILEDRPREIWEFFDLAPLWLGLAASVAFGGLAMVFRRWYTSGRDDRAHETIVPEYEPPGKLHPAQIGLLIDERADTLDVTATIVDLAVRGYLSITELPKEGLLGSRDWLLTRMRDGDGLEPYEVVIFDGLFTGGDEVRLSALKRHFYTSLAKAQSELYADSVKHGWFTVDPARTRATYAAIGVGLVVLAGIVAAGFGYIAGGGVVGVAAAIPAIALIAASGAMPAKTRAGSDLERQSLGFQRYMEVAEKDRQAFAEKEQIFAAYLPYAIVFRCVDQWARAFAGIDLTAATSSWYTGANMANFSAMNMSRDLSSFSENISTAIASTPGGSGGSGFSGGGSGGGGGGGGGGSW
ncbi:MAG: DUF2207 domain-containing protein, partial [Chloroflexota bacterium]|nr:DUF2207 domain-containing protein [Chloroflexota bacterium]